MKITPPELPVNGYELIDTLKHQEIVPFVREYLKKKTFFSQFYTWANVFSFGLIGIFFGYGYTQENFDFAVAFGHLSYGFALAFTLVPLHEYIHALAYKHVGAEHTSYDANLKKFYFMAMADMFVANKKEFQIVALAPFAFISGVLLLLLPMVGHIWLFTVLGTLMTHTAFCSGDFGLLSYFDFHADKTIVTYDDKENKISYFYELKQ